MFRALKVYFRFLAMNNLKKAKNYICICNLIKFFRKILVKIFLFAKLSVFLHTGNSEISSAERNDFIRENFSGKNFAFFFYEILTHKKLLSLTAGRKVRRAAVTNSS